MVQVKVIFLPDLPYEKTGEQIVLEQKVFRTNELFIKRHQGNCRMVVVSRRVQKISKQCQEEQIWLLKMSFKV